MAATALFALFAVQSCKESTDENTSPKTDLGKATIKGNIIADLDLTNAQKEAMAGVTVTFYLNTQDLISNYNYYYYSGNYYNYFNGYRSYSGVTDQDGNYSVDIEVGTKGVNVTMAIPELVNGNQKQENGSTISTQFQKMTYTGNSVYLVRNQVYTQNVEYRGNINPEIGTMTISGDVRYRNDLCATGTDQYATVPANTKLLVQWYDDYGRNKQLSVNVDATGKYTFTTESVSNNRYFYISGVQFNGSRKTPNGMNCDTNNNYTYTLFGGGSTTVYVNKGETAVRNYDFQ